MPELSRFGGMVIYMLFCDIGQHNKPHVHVYYGEYEASYEDEGTDAPENTGGRGVL